MSPPEEVVYARVYDPANSVFKTSSKDPAEYEVISCSNKGACELYARGQCTMVGIFPQRCKYGSRHFEKGPTKRAAGYSKWIAAKKAAHPPEVMWSLKSPTKKMAVVGEMLYLPYPHVNMLQSLPVERHSSIVSWGTNFIPLDRFTPDVAKSIIQFRPQAMFGGEITSYQREVVPLFVKHLRERFPEIYAKVADDRVAAMEQKSNVGRTALLRSLKPGTVLFKSTKSSSGPPTVETWEWDGTRLRSTDAGVLFSFVPYRESMITLVPKEDATVKITDDDQVDSDTEYID